MAISKVTLNGTTQMDVTDKTVTEDSLLKGITALKNDGTDITGNVVFVDDHIYGGTDLSTKYATEISGYTDVWAWIKARITAGNYDGIHVGDYIPFITSNNVQLEARIIGINTYKKYGDVEVGNHIDFWAGLWPTKKAINPANYNNGTSVSLYPWLASDAYLYANSLSGQIPSTATANPTLTAVDYTSGGIYYYLPAALKSVIAEKRLLLERRYTSGSLLTDSTSWGWTSIGKIWFPTEREVYGVPVLGNKEYAVGGCVQYPFFANCMNMLAFGRTNWWVITPRAGNSQGWCEVGSSGNAYDSFVSGSNVAAPVCFRIA